MNVLQNILLKHLFHFFYLSILSVSIVSTVSAQLVLSEIDPSSEFIEVYNENFNEDKSVTSFIWSELTSSGEEKKYEISSVEILAGDFFVFEMSRKINNSGDTIKIYSSDGELLDSKIIPKLESGKTYQKNFETTEWFWESATKGLENKKLNIIATPTSTPNTISSNIIISEILPNPDGRDGDDNEFIELYNSENFEINISDFFLQDKSGKKYTFPQNTILQAGEYKAFYKRDTKIILNNSDEFVYLYNSSDYKISTLGFVGSAPNAQSYIVLNNENNFTETLTPNAENILYNTVIQNSSSSSSSSSSKIVDKENFTLFPKIYRKKFENKNIYQNDLQLLISKISISGKPDFIEAYCQNCNNTSAQIAGVMLSIDGIAYQIPQNNFTKNIKTGDLLRFEFYKNTEENIKNYTFHKENGIYVFPVFGKSSSGLVTSDEVIAFGKINGEILDAMCYANMSANGTLISSEKKDLGFVILQNQWIGELKEWGCVNSSTLTKDTIFERISWIDTNSKHDFIRRRSPQNKKFEKFKNINALKISQIELSPQKLIIRIQNISKNPVIMQDWYIANHQNFFLDIKKQNDTEDGKNADNFLLYPNQFITLKVESSAKKYAKENLFLSIRNASGEISDAFCINKAKDEKGLKKSIFTASEFSTKNIWKKESRKNLCFEYRDIRQKYTFVRNNFTNPAQVNFYTKKVSEELEEVENTEEIEEIKDVKNYNSQHVENLCISVKKEKFGIKIFGDISACKIKNYSDEKDEETNKITKIRIYIPKKNIKLETKIINNKFEFYIEKLLKKGNYAIDIRLFAKIKKYSVARQKIKIKEHVLFSEFGNIEISKVLPNPEGRDKGQEKIIVQNSQSFPHWVRNWSINNKILPSFFVEGNSEFIIPSYYLPSLKNKNSKLVLKNSWGEIVSVVHWKKARNNEWFGKNAEKYIPKTKHKKLNKSKKHKRNKNNNKIKKLKFNKKEILEGVIEKIIYVTDKNNSDIIIKKLAYIKLNHKKNNINNIKFKIHPNIRNKKYIMYEIPDYLPNAEKIFKVGQKVDIFVKSGKVQNVKIAQINSDKNAKLKTNFKTTKMFTIDLKILFLILFGISLIGVFLLILLNTIYKSN